MAKIPPKKNTKGKPPKIEKTIDNLDKPELGKLKPMNFKVSQDFHKEYKTFAAINNMSMQEVLLKSFELIKEKTEF